jgi:hypothetical protein
MLTLPKRASDQMSKIPVGRAELEARVLSDIRRYSGCADVKEIALTAVTIVGSSHTWHVNIIDEGVADINKAYAAARNVQLLLAPLYELID